MLQNLTWQAFVLQVHIEVSGLLGRPFACWFGYAWRDPNSSSLDMDEDEEMKIDHPFERSRPFKLPIPLQVLR